MDESSATATQLQDPDVELKPKVTADQALDIIWRLYGLKASNLKELPSYDDLNYFFNAYEESIENDNISEVNPDGYVLKILNSLQSTNPVNIEANHALMRCALKGGIATQAIILNRTGKDYSIETFTDENTGVLGPYAVRIVTFVPGTIFHQTPYVAGSFRNVGEYVGKFHDAIKVHPYTVQMISNHLLQSMKKMSKGLGFHHPFYDTYSIMWSLLHVSNIRDFIKAVKDEKDRAVVLQVIDDFENNVKPEFENFRKGIIHGDINEQNLIMRKVAVAEGDPDQGIHDVAAILDFADSSLAYIVMDVAISIAYLSIECPYETQLDVGGHTLSGYYKYSSLNKAEKKCLKTLVCSRLCQSLVYGAHSYAQQPWNDYILTTSKQGWPLLHRLWATDRDELYKRWDDIIAKGH